MPGEAEHGPPASTTAFCRRRSLAKRLATRRARPSRPPRSRPARPGRRHRSSYPPSQKCCRQPVTRCARSSAISRRSACEAARSAGRDQEIAGPVDPTRPRLRVWAPDKRRERHSALQRPVQQRRSSPSPSCTPHSRTVSRQRGRPHVPQLAPGPRAARSRAAAPAPLAAVAAARSRRAAGSPTRPCHHAAAQPLAAASVPCDSTCRLGVSPRRRAAARWPAGRRGGAAASDRPAPGSGTACAGRPPRRPGARVSTPCWRRSRPSSRTPSPCADAAACRARFGRDHPIVA